jgi:hypothetical protein
LFFSVLIILCTGVAHAVDLTATVDKSMLSLNDRIVLTVTITGLRDAPQPILPPLDSFSVADAGRSTRIQIVNNRTTMSTSYEYILTPLKTGTQVIGPITVNYQGQAYRTKPIDVEVVKDASVAGTGRVPVRVGAEKAKERKDTAARGMFIELSTNTSDVFLHEQVVLIFRFYYSNVRLGEQPSYEAPPTPGFVGRQLDKGQSRNYSQVIDGRLYQVSELRTALFPYQTGELSIGPAKLEGSLLVESARRTRRPDRFFDDFFSDPFFGGFSRKPFELVSNKVTVNVRPLPEEGAPGGEVSVGSYKLDVDAKPREVNVGDPITLTMSVTGDGDLETVAPPKVSNLMDFKSYEATSSTQITERGNTVWGTKTFEQAIVPLSEKVQKIPQIVFPYFDPKQKRYVILKKGPIPIKVLPAKEKATKIVSLPLGPGERGVKLLERNIVFIKASPGRLFKGHVSPIPSRLFLLINCVPVLLLVLAIIHHRHRERLQSDHGYARLHSASRLVKQRLRSAEEALKGRKAEDFYGRLARAINMYVADRLNIPAGGLTPEIVLRKLEERGISHELLERLDTLYRSADNARFGSALEDSAKMERAFGEGRAILEELRSAKF